MRKASKYLKLIEELRLYGNVKIYIELPKEGEFFKPHTVILNLQNTLDRYENEYLHAIKNNVDLNKSAPMLANYNLLQGYVTKFKNSKIEQL